MQACALGTDLGHPPLRHCQRRCRQGLLGHHRAWRRHRIRRLATAQQRDQLGIGDQAADARSRQRVRLGQGAQHRQIVVARKQANGRGHIGEFAIGFIHYHQRLALQRLQGSFDFGQRDRRAGRIGRRAQEHQLGLGVQRGLHDRRHIGMQTIRPIDQRHFDQRRVLQARAHCIHAEHRRRDHHRIALGHAQATHQQIDGLVAAAADQQLLGRTPVQLRQRRTQALGLRIGIATRAGVGIGRISPGRLVGVEPHIALQRTRARRRITCKCAQIVTHQIHYRCRAHAATPMRSATALACASRPSARARITAHAPIPSIPALLAACTLTMFWKLATLTPL